MMFQDIQDPVPVIDFFADVKHPDRMITQLHLLTANAGSDQSTVDDGISSDAEDERAKSEAQSQTELQRMNSENQRLRDMLGQVTNNYSVLQMHLVALMQQQQSQGAADTTQDHEVVEGKSEERKHEINGGVVVPRQFMDLGPGGPADQTDEASHSSSEDRTISGSPRNASKNEVVRVRKRVGREESPESESQGWNPNKIPKLNPAKPEAIDQSAEAPMRKARVSVRARSEAPMMAKGNPLPFQRTPPQFPVHFSGQPQRFRSMPTPPLPAQVFSHAPQSHQPQQPQPSLADRVSAATTAITADLNFTAALAAAITTNPNFTAALAAAISSINNRGYRAHPNNNTNNNNNNNTHINFPFHPSSAGLNQTTTTPHQFFQFPFFLREKIVITCS